jgi:hypothetical protein
VPKNSSAVVRPPARAALLACDPVAADVAPFGLAAAGWSRFGRVQVVVRVV